jgi:hypothetical protein
METKTPKTEETFVKEDMVFGPVPPPPGVRWPYNRGPKKFGKKRPEPIKKVGWRDDL